MSARSNEDRFGVPPEGLEATNQPAEVPQNQESLKFITPTEFVELPSKGHFYDLNHPLHNQDVVEIKHMTTKEEDILTSITLLKKGLALDRMLESILVDKRIKVDDLLLGDKNALVIAARLHGYGPEYEATVKCPECSESQKYSFDLNTLEIKFPTDDLLAKYKIEKTNNNTFLVPLPQTDYTAEVRFLTGYDEKKVSAAKEHKKKRNFPETSVSDFLRFVIVSVNNISDAAALNTFINTLPALHARYMRKVYNELIPSLDMKHSFDCSVCQHRGVLEVPLDANFFWFNA